ncbi:MAG: RidA family protein [Alphaproteobacteria bacterium]|jgi:enamine deaminase RidA (YjgF/YER057c/UK114 family)|nr:RidA family protein [Alphaproteobacteria bacterium]
MHDVILPEGWPRPKGYSNAILAKPGRSLFLAGQVGWDSASETFASEQIAPQFEQALKNILALVRAAGGKPQDICKITAFCCDRAAYLAARADLGRIWKEQMGHHYPCMSMIFVSDLLDHPAKIELEATAVIPD